MYCWFEIVLPHLPTACLCALPLPDPHRARIEPKRSWPAASVPVHIPARCLCVCLATYTTHATNHHHIYNCNHNHNKHGAHHRMQWAKEKLTWQQTVVIWWAGLTRGAVSVALT